MATQDDSVATTSDQLGGDIDAGESSIASWAQGGVANGASLTERLLIGNSGASISSSSFGQKIKAAVEADKAAVEAKKAAAEAAAVAKAKNDELEQYIARHAQNRGVARAAEAAAAAAAAGSNVDSGVSMDSTATDQADDAFDNMLAKIQDPSNGVLNKTIVDNSSPNNETHEIGEIVATSDFDDQSVSSVSVNMDISNHIQGAETGTEFLPNSSEHHPVRSRNAFLHHHVPFPITLHSLLKENPCPSAICWNTEGTKVVLHTKHKEFDQILHSYFGDNTKFSNLRRKANRWTFRTKCVHSETSKYHIWNKRFRRDEDPICLDICPTEAKRAGHKRAETPHHLPARSSTTDADNKRSISANTRGTLPTLVTASTNDASSPSFSYQMSTREGAQGSSRPTPSNRKRKARPKLPFAMQEQSAAGSYLPVHVPRDSAGLSEWLAEADI